MSTDTPRVYLIDDEVRVRRGLCRLLSRAGYAVTEFGSGLEFLAAELPDALACIILDVRMPGLDGLRVQEQLETSDLELPIIFLTGHGTVDMSVQAMRAGAVTFLEKPVDRSVLLSAVSEALARDAARRSECAVAEELRLRYQRLTPREREIFPLIATGLTSRQIATRLGTSEKTIEVHRGALASKMGADCVADVVLMAVRLALIEP